MIAFLSRWSSFYLFLALSPVITVAGVIIYFFVITAPVEVLFFVGCVCGVLLIMAWIRYWMTMYYDERETEKEYERIARNRHP